MKSSFGKQIHEDYVLSEFFKNYDYTKDSDYYVWEEQLYDENNKFSFEKTLRFCKIEIENPEIKKVTKNKWLNLIQEWNQIRYENPMKDSTELTTLGYVAITYLYIVIPYDNCTNKTNFDPLTKRHLFITEFQAKLINICMLHETGENLSYFTDYDMLTLYDPPHDPDIFEQYLDEQYNTACWFLTFLLYLSEKGIKLNHKGALGL